MDVSGVGLDIGVEQVRAVALHRRRHQVIVTGIGLRAVAQRANDEAVARAVQLALRDAGAAKHAAVCAAVGGPSVVVKGIQLPRTPLPRVLEAVRWSLQERGLVPAGGVILDAQVLSTSAEGRMHVLAVCVPQELIEQRLRILALAGVTPQKMDVGPLALLNAVLTLQGVATDETLVLLSMAPEAALICLYHAAAGAPLLRYLQGQQQSAAEMIGEIRTAVAYFQAELAAASTLRVVYCGPESAFIELHKEMLELLALWNHRDGPILFDPLAMLEGVEDILLAGIFVEGPQFAQALGLALRML